MVSQAERRAGTVRAIEEAARKLFATRGFAETTIDDIATKVDYATWVELSTITNATTMAGERGGVMRDLKDGRKIIASFRELQADAKKHCFLNE